MTKYWANNLAIWSHCLVACRLALALLLPTATPTTPTPTARHKRRVNRRKEIYRYKILYLFELTITMYKLLRESIS